MSKNEADSGFNYLQIVEQSRVLPPDPPKKQPSVGILEFLPQFNTEEPEQPISDEKVKKGNIAIASAVRHHSRVFVIWKPWEKCSRCKEGIDSGHIVLPERSDHTCPHVQRLDYKDVIDRGLQGKATISFKEPFSLQDGTRCVHVEWMELDPEEAKKLEKAQAEKKETRVWPPDVEGAFNKDRGEPSEPKK